MADKKITMKNSWDAMAKLWASYSVPAKPSPVEIKFYEARLKSLLLKNKNIRALVLESTPELRDLLAKYHINTTFVDNNNLSIKAMTQLMKRKNIKERAMVGDWLKMPFKANSFDVVLSDASQDNIKFSEFNKFFNLIYKILKPNGYWFFGALCGRKGNQIPFKKYADLYRSNPESFKGFKNMTYRYFQLCFCPQFYNTKTKKFNFNAADQAIKKLVDIDRLPVSALKHACFNLDYKQTTLTWEALKKIIERKFIVLDEKRDRSHIVMKNKWAAILTPKK